MEGINFVLGILALLRPRCQYDVGHEALALGGSKPLSWIDSRYQNRWHIPRHEKCESGPRYLWLDNATSAPRAKVFHSISYSPHSTTALCASISSCIVQAPLRTSCDCTILSWHLCISRAILRVLVVAISLYDEVAFWRGASPMDTYPY